VSDPSLVVDRRPAGEPERGGAGTALIAWLATLLIRVLRASVRLRFHDDATVRSWERQRQRFVIVFWHRHLPLMRYAYCGNRMNVLISRSRDGEVLARVMARFGVRASRGSSSRGGAAGLRDLLRAAKSGSDIALAPDGPRGPLREVQPGAVLLAAASGLPLVPVAIAASRSRQLHSWDRMPVPLPGSRVHVVYGEPLRVPRDARVEEWAPRIQAAINDAEQRAEKLARGEEA